MDAHRLDLAPLCLQAAEPAYHTHRYERMDNAPSLGTARNIARRSRRTFYPMLPYQRPASDASQGILGARNRAATAISARERRKSRSGRMDGNGQPPASERCMIGVNERG